MLVAPGKLRIEPVALRWAKTSSSSRPFGFVIAPSYSAMRDQDAAAFAAELGGVIADVAEALHDDALAVEPGREAEPLHVLGFVARFAQREVEAAAGRFLAAAHAALRDRLAGDAAERVELSGIERRVGVGDPRHLALAGAVVGRRHVDAGADEVFFISSCV